jgi:hypothetical protein
MAKMTPCKNVAGLNKALRQVPKEANVQLRDASVEIAANVASIASKRARSVGGVAALVAPTIKATRDRIPVVKMGSSQKLPTAGNGWTNNSRSGARQTIGDVIWGAEFGGGARPSTSQFSPWLGSGPGAGYFLYPTIRGMQRYIQDTYSEALYDALQKVK